MEWVLYNLPDGHHGSNSLDNSFLDVMLDSTACEINSCLVETQMGYHQHVQALSLQRGAD